MPEFYFVRINRFILMSLFLLALIGCNKENQPDFPLVITGEVMNVTSKGAEFHGRISGNSDGITDHGFVWDQHEEPLIGNGYQRSLGPFATDNFSIETEAAFKEGVLYYVRAYARNSQSTVYGRTAVFKSLGGTSPQISDFYPKEGTWSDTLTIRGKNFSRMNDQNLVKTGIYVANCIASSDTLLKAIVPGSLINVRSKVSVTVFGNTSASADDFILLPPEIHEITPEEGPINTTITLTGKNFHPQAKVFFDDKQGQIVSATNNQILVKVPTFSDEQDVKITIDILGQVSKEEHNFKFLFPVITGFSSPTGTWDDQLVIYGRNFPVHSGTEIRISETKVTILHINQDSITVRIPRFLTRYSHFITIKSNYYSPGDPSYSQAYTSKMKFELIKPTITGFTPGQAGFGDIVEISGTYFHPDEFENIVRFDGIKAEIISHSHSLLRVKVPVEMQKTSAVLSLQIHDYKLPAAETFLLVPLQITGLNALWFSRSYPIKIYGSGFNTDSKYNNVFWGNEKLFVGEVGGGFILAGRAFEYNKEPPFDARKLKVEVAGQLQEINDMVRYYEPWTYYHVSHHFLKSVKDVGFSIGDRHFIGQAHTIYEYYPSSNSVVRKADLPFERGVESINDGIFSTASNAYILHEHGFYKYNPETDKWSKMNEFPGSLNNGVFAFKAGNNSYMMGGIVKISKNGSTVEEREVWKFNEVDDSWTKVVNFPATDILKGIRFTINGKGYVGLGGIGKIWEYDSENDSWMEKTDMSNKLTYDPYYSRSVFVLDNYAYVVFTSTVYRFDLVKNTFTRIIDLPIGVSGYNTFSHMGKGYVIGGYGGGVYGGVQIFNPANLPPPLMPD